MTDNRTTELLRELRRTLEKCRRTEEAGFDTYWITAVALDTSLDELEQAIAATLGVVGSEVGSEVCGGKLTAEQVREAIERHVKFYEGGDYDEQAIADDLNSMLWSGTCELTLDGTDGCFGCSECLENIPPLANFCPNCGKRIRKAVER